MHIVQIDVGQSKTLQRLFKGLTSIFWSAVDFARAIWVRLVGELGCKEDVIAFVWVVLEPLT